MKEENIKHIAIFVSGAGSNATHIIKHLRDKKSSKVSLLLSNKPEKGATEISVKEGVSLYSFGKDDLINGTKIIDVLKEKKIDLIVLAGFLLKIPENLVRAFPNKIVNIHPALLPKYGGKGMYGKHVHQAVFDNKEKETGITIHLVNENYDEGNVIVQHKVALSKQDTPESIEQKVRGLEQKYFASTIERFINNEI